MPVLREARFLFVAGNMRAALTILVVEDDQNDTTLLKLAFARTGGGLQIHWMDDGSQAIAYLVGSPPFANRASYPPPNLLVLDLKMPGTTGFEVLEWLRKQPARRPSFVAVLSGSQWKADAERVRGLGADCYIVKPCNFDQLVGVTRWLIQESSARLAIIASGRAPRMTINPLHRDSR